MYNESTGSILIDLVSQDPDNIHEYPLTPLVFREKAKVIYYLLEVTRMRKSFIDYNENEIQ